MATKVSVKNLKRLEARVKKQFLKVTKDKKMLKEIGIFSVERIKLFARRGSPMRKTRRKGRFPKLADATPKMKRELAKNNPGLTHPAFGKSGRERNITQTGQLLDALKFKVRKNVIQLFVKGKRKLLRDSKGNVIKDQAKTSQKVYDELLKRNVRYNIMNINPQGIKRINQIIKRNLRRILKR